MSIILFSFLDFHVLPSLSSLRFKLRQYLLDDSGELVRSSQSVHMLRLELRECDRSPHDFHSGIGVVVANTSTMSKRHPFPIARGQVSIGQFAVKVYQARLVHTHDP